MVTGSVRIKRTGLTIALTIPKTSATINAVAKESICTPERMYEVIKTAIAEINQFINSRIREGFQTSSLNTSSPELVS